MSSDLESKIKKKEKKEKRKEIEKGKKEKRKGKKRKRDTERRSNHTGSWDQLKVTANYKIFTGCELRIVNEVWSVLGSYFAILWTLWWTRLLTRALSLSLSLARKKILKLIVIPLLTHVMMYFHPSSRHCQVHDELDVQLFLNSF